MTVHGKTYSNDYLFLSRIPFTTVCKPFEKICICSNDLVTHSLETPTRSNDLVTRSLETPTRSNDLVTCSLETLTRSNNLVTCSLETPTRSNDLITCSLETVTRSNDLVTRSQETPACWIKYLTVIISQGLVVFSLSRFYISCQGSLSLFHKIS